MKPEGLFEIHLVTSPHVKVTRAPSHPSLEVMKHSKRRLTGLKSITPPKKKSEKEQLKSNEVDHHCPYSIQNR